MSLALCLGRESSLGFLFPDPLVRRVVGQVPGSRKLKGFWSGARREKQNKGFLNLSHSKSVISPTSASACSRRDARPVTASIVAFKNTAALILTKKYETRYLLFQIRGYNPFLPPIALAIRGTPKPVVKNHPNPAHRIVAEDHTRRSHQLHPLMQSSKLMTKKWNISKVQNHRYSNSTELAAECIEREEVEYTTENSSVSFGPVKDII